MSPTRATDFMNEYEKHLLINDISLPLGGKFDYKADWQAPHCDHRYGRGADLRTIVFSDEEIRFIQRRWDRIAGRLRYVYEGDPPHLHVKTDK